MPPQPSVVLSAFTVTVISSMSGSPGRKGCETTSPRELRGGRNSQRREQPTGGAANHQASRGECARVTA
jgi:hypothetical protein